MEKYSELYNADKVQKEVEIANQELQKNTISNGTGSASDLVDAGNDLLSEFDISLIESIADGAEVVKEACVAILEILSGLS